MPRAVELASVATRILQYGANYAPLLALRKAEDSEGHLGRQESAASGRRPGCLAAVSVRGPTPGCSLNRQRADVDDRQLVAVESHYRGLVFTSPRASPLPRPRRRPRGHQIGPRRRFCGRPMAPPTLAGTRGTSGQVSRKLPGPRLWAATRVECGVPLGCRRGPRPNTVAPRVYFSRIKRALRIRATGYVTSGAQAFHNGFYFAMPGTTPSNGVLARCKRNTPGYPHRSSYAARVGLRHGQAKSPASRVSC
jgi:hypothetical protein